MGGRSAFDLAVNLWNVILGVAFVVAGVMPFFAGGAASGSLAFWVVGATVVMLGIVTVLVELKPPRVAVKLFGWYRWWASRGVFLIVMGCFCGSVNGCCGRFSWEWFFGLLPIATGIIYIVLHFVNIRLPGPLLGGSNYSKL